MLVLFFLPFNRQSLTRPKTARKIKRTKELKELAVSGCFNYSWMPKGCKERDSYQECDGVFLFYSDPVSKINLI